ncbi:MAG: hypothetical protein Q3X95_07840, partial [Duodenibacillus sp.]|nr:hypothetical protein [Duodenibacillus sp.]
MKNEKIFKSSHPTGSAAADTFPYGSSHDWGGVYVVEPSPTPAAGRVEKMLSRGCLRMPCGFGFYALAFSALRHQARITSTVPST